MRLFSTKFEHYPFIGTVYRLRQCYDCIITDRVRGSRLEPPYDQHGVTIQGVNERKLKRNKHLIAQLESRIAEVDRAIADMDDPELKVALILKYQDGLTWNEVGREMCICGETLRKRAERYFVTLGPIR